MFLLLFLCSGAGIKAGRPVLLKFLLCSQQNGEYFNNLSDKSFLSFFSSKISLNCSNSSLEISFSLLSILSIESPLNASSSTGSSETRSLILLTSSFIVLVLALSTDSDFFLFFELFSVVFYFVFSFQHDYFFFFCFQTGPHSNL